ncbi:hypothetical protein [Paenibacillus abyssi]|uniref:Uncharacterized protein n=1 Tax=Paenibacillus abyssi TaxID=1340531 RepID=A0A917CGN8_9BACL|nr:hypothetical protein [Paenibacillus abyssi]GGF88188.1 hypothetical protein GCM10010916_01850 [Paenibacillus abyssi]
MAELKILGVKRVEALLAVLDAKEKQEKAALIIPSSEEITRMVDEEFGIASDRARVKELVEEASEILARLNEVTGNGSYAQISHSYSRQRDIDGGAYKKRVEELTEQLRKKPLDDLAKQFEQKRTQLWMCETLEQAKAIVGIS